MSDRLVSPAELDLPNDDRALGPEMKGEGWVLVGGDWVMWQHPPTKRSVVVRGPCPPNKDIALHGAPDDPAAEGYVVCCTHHDEHGNPTEGDAFWVPSYGEALLRARRIRTQIMSETRDVSVPEQGDLFDG